MKVIPLLLIFILIIILVNAYVRDIKGGWAQLTNKANKTKAQTDSGIGIPDFTVSSQVFTDLFPYVRKDSFFIQTERSLYEGLHLILDKHGYQIFSKVRLSEVFYLPKGLNKRQIYQNKIESNSIDFIICDGTDIKPLLGIKLDDAVHSTIDLVEQNNFINEVFKQVGLSIVRIPLKSSYTVDEVRDQIKQYIPLEDKTISISPTIK